MLELLSAGKPLPTTPGSPLSLGFDDRLHFSHYIVTEKDWGKALAYQAILVRRNLAPVPRAIKPVSDSLPCWKRRGASSDLVYTRAGGRRHKGGSGGERSVWLLGRKVSTRY